MDLLPLPQFYHLPLLAFVVFLLLAIFLLYKTFRKKPKSVDFNDPYAITKALRQCKPTPQIKELLQELEKYKYRPTPPKLPKSLKRRVRKVLQYKKRRLL